MIAQKTAIIVIALVTAGNLSALRADDNAATREAWRQRLDDQTAVAYSATVTVKRIGQGADKAAVDEARLAARLKTAIYVRSAAG